VGHESKLAKSQTGGQMMEQDKLDITGLKNAINALQTSIDTWHKYSANKDIGLSESLRSGIIQNFEVAYELCWKFMKRWLEINISHDIVSGVSRKEFFRIAGENRLIADVEKWWEFHDARNRTSHVYDSAVADDVLETTLQFMPHAKNFLVCLEKRL
jgi:nucleotidyltransferase substrate binding protein (TIGR01987 family)